MNLFYPIKKKIIASNFNKKRNNNPINIKENELYQLKGDESKFINNSYFFGGYSVKDKSALVLRLGIRNNLPYEVFVFYKDKDTFLVTPKDYYKDNPLTISCVEPGKKWDVCFNNDLIDAKTHKTHKVSFNFVFTSRREIYDFFHSYQSEYMIEAVSHCKWNKTFKEEMSKLDQRHYEQSGFIKGNITIDNKTTKLNLAGGRDHSFGLRDWNAMNDHIWLLAVKDNGEIFNYSLVNYPLLKNIHNGYIDVNKDKLVSVKKILHLDYQANDGEGIDDTTIKIKFDDNSISNIKVHRDSYFETHYQNGDYIFQEGFGTFEIDGEILYGSIEYGFNKDKSKWEIKPICK